MNPINPIDINKLTPRGVSALITELESRILYRKEAMQALIERIKQLENDVAALANPIWDTEVLRSVVIKLAQAFLHDQRIIADAVDQAITQMESDVSALRSLLLLKTTSDNDMRKQ